MMDSARLDPAPTVTSPIALSDYQDRDEVLTPLPDNSAAGIATEAQTVKQFLVVSDDLAWVLDHLTVQVTVVQSLPPRLAIVQSADDAGPALRAAPGVRAVGAPALPETVRSTLTDEELLFADAFVIAGAPKTRPGDGAAWDAPGFTPPDRPPRR